MVQWNFLILVYRNPKTVQYIIVSQALVLFYHLVHLELGLVPINSVGNSLVYKRNEDPSLQKGPRFIFLQKIVLIFRQV